MVNTSGVELGAIVNGSEIGKGRGRFIRVRCPSQTGPDCPGERWVFYRALNGNGTQKVCGPCNRRQANRGFHIGWKYGQH